MRTVSSRSANFMRNGLSRSATHHSCALSAESCLSEKRVSPLSMLLYVGF